VRSATAPGPVFPGGSEEKGLFERAALPVTLIAWFDWLPRFVQRAQRRAQLDSTARTWRQISSVAGCAGRWGGAHQRQLNQVTTGDRRRGDQAKTWAILKGQVGRGGGRTGSTITAAAPV